MKLFLLKKLLELIPTFFGITLIIFFVIHLAPGNPIDSMGTFNPNITSESLEQMKKIYHLNQPLYIQYIAWLKSILDFNFGISLVDGRNVMDKVMDRLPVTVGINVATLILTFLIGVPIGIISSLKKNRLIDKFFTFVVFSGYAVPSFWLALLLMIAFSVHWHLLPLSGLHSMNVKAGLPYYLDLSKHLIMPIFIGVFGSLAGISRYVRKGMIDVLDKDFIKLLYAKKIPKRKIIYAHALKNTMLPVITILGLSIPGLIGGSVIIESIFAIPGMGQLFYYSALSRDYPTIMCILTISTILTLLGNLLADIAYALVDPRIKYEK